METRPNTPDAHTDIFASDTQVRSAAPQDSAESVRLRSRETVHRSPSIDHSRTDLAKPKAPQIKMRDAILGTPSIEGQPNIPFPTSYHKSRKAAEPPVPSTPAQQTFKMTEVGDVESPPRVQGQRQGRSTRRRKIRQAEAQPTERFRSVPAPIQPCPNTSRSSQRAPLPLGHSRPKRPTGDTERVCANIGHQTIKTARRNKKLLGRLFAESRRRNLLHNRRLR